MIINSASETPLYLQLYEHYKESIVHGNLKSGEKLPSKRSLAELLGVSQNTVTKAYYLLEEEGYINAVQRSGYYVEKLHNTYLRKTSIDTPSIKEEKKENIKYNFSSSSIAQDQFPFYTFSKLYKDVFDKNDENILTSSQTHGTIFFRKAISKYLEESRGLLVNPDNIVVSSGMEYLFEILFYIFEDDTKFAVENPGYDVLPPMIKSRGFEFIPLEIAKDGVDISKLKESSANILCITPSHQFPTGTIMPIRKRLEILKWANESERNYIIEDDYDSEFRFVGKPIDPLKSLDTKDKVIYFGSFSKSIAPSFRTSYMILPNKLIEKLVEDAPFFICSVPVVDQIVLGEFLERGYFERHLNRMRRIYKKRREVAIEELEKSPKVLNITGADSGIHIVVEFKTDQSDTELKRKLLARGIFIQSLSEYYSKNPKYESKFILGFGGMNKEKLREGIKLLLDTV